MLRLLLVVGVTVLGGCATAPAPGATVPPGTPAASASPGPAGSTAAQATAGDALGRLVDLTAERLDTADRVAASKWISGGPISDPPRDTVVLNAATAGSPSRGLDPQRSAAVFRDQIEASKVVQYGLFSGWTADPASAPGAAPDLTTVRPVLDRITGQLLDALAATSAPRSGPACAPDLRADVFRVASARHLDPLHRRGLDRAVRSLCG